MQVSSKAAAIAPSATLGIDTKAKMLAAEGKKVINFGVGEPDFDTPEYIKEAAAAALKNGKTKYTPANGIPELREEICKRYFEKYGLGYSAANVVVTNGAKQALYNTFQAILNPGDEVIIIAPYWVTYPEQVKLAGGVPVYVEAAEERAFAPDPKDIEAAVTENTRAIIVNSPSNPCGNIYDKAMIEAIVKIAEAHDLYIISDEIYDELAYDSECFCPASFGEDAKKRTVIVNGMSKTFAMTGWRMGYTISGRELASVMTGSQSHSTGNPCSIAQYAALAALSGPKTDVKQMVDEFARRARVIYALVQDCPFLSCLMPEGAFYVFANVKALLGKKYKGKAVQDSMQLSELLLEEKLVAVVPGSAFGKEGYIRLSYATSMDSIKEGLARIKDFCVSLTD